MERQVKLTQNVGPFIQIIWLIVFVLLVGCMTEDVIPSKVRKGRGVNFQDIKDKEYHGMNMHWEEIMPGHDFTKSGTLTLYFLENPSRTVEISEIYLISKDRSKQSQFRIPGLGKDNRSNYSIAMIPNTFNEGPPCIQIKLISGPGEQYDEILAHFKK